MDSYNVLRGREPVRTGTPKSPNDKTKYCAGYIKYLPQRGAMYGIEFSGTKYTDGEATYKTPECGFRYYIFCSENAFLDYLSSAYADAVDEEGKDGQNPPVLKHRVSKAASVGNPATFIVSSGIYNPGDTAGLKDEGIVRDAIKYPANIGFQGVSYNHEPRPYSNLDGFIDSNNVQYPLYLVVIFDGDPKISVLDYQLIIQS